MICIVIAAGYATRMGELTKNFPKPLLKVEGRPVLNWLLADIETIPQVERVYVVSNHKFIGFFTKWLQEQTADFRKPIQLLDDGSTSKDNRLGAVKDIAFALEQIGGREDALVLAGDNVLEFPLQGFVDFFQKKQRSCIMCYREPDLERQRRTGIITLDAACRVKSFAEKPQEPESDLAVPPFYCYTRTDLDLLPRAFAEGCPTDDPGSLAAYVGRQSELYAWNMPGKRYDIGTIPGYESVQKLYKPFLK
jgi:glucose-1-phosphate thymidylyltransferase